MLLKLTRVRPEVKGQGTVKRKLFFSPLKLLSFSSNVISTCQSETVGHCLGLSAALTASKTAHFIIFLIITIFYH